MTDKEIPFLVIRDSIAGLIFVRILMLVGMWYTFVVQFDLLTNLYPAKYIAWIYLVAVFLWSHCFDVVIRVYPSRLEMARVFSLSSPNQIPLHDIKTVVISAPFILTTMEVHYTKKPDTEAAYYDYLTAYTYNHVKTYTFYDLDTDHLAQTLTDIGIEVRVQTADNQ